MQTSIVNKHFHTYKKGGKRTSFDSGHFHVIKSGKKITESAGQLKHTHKL